VDAKRDPEMNTFETPDHSIFTNYTNALSNILKDYDWSIVEQLAHDLWQVRQNGKQVFICGNGGSAGNAMHIANDFLYGASPQKGGGLRVNALSSNSSVLTCLGNDLGYEEIFSYQLATLAQAGDILIVLSGSGNSANIVKALEQAKSMAVKSYAILGFSGGKAKDIADASIHFAIDDMQISEDLQMIVAHMLMKWLRTANTKSDNNE
jgi:D-sedoheptulose 7-phosphate isomerase